MPDQQTPQRPAPDEIRPFEWLYWAFVDAGLPREAEGMLWALSAFRGAMEDMRWQADRRREVQQKHAKLQAHAAEWLRGCSNAPAGAPWKCVECTRAYAEAVRPLLSSPVFQVAAAARARVAGDDPAALSSWGGKDQAKEVGMQFWMWLDQNRDDCINAFSLMFGQGCPHNGVRERVVIPFTATPAEVAAKLQELADKVAILGNRPPS